MEITRIENKPLLKYLSRRGPAGAALLAAPGTAPDPYYGCGSHPDVVARIWDEIGSKLPGAGRVLVHQTPALIHTASNIIMAVAIGTQYALRLPGSLNQEAVSAGTNTETTWSDGSRLDVRAEFGADWVLGSWDSKEADWCLRACENFDLSV